MKYIFPFLFLCFQAFCQTEYQEPLRPQFHFSPQKNWTNDPNGLVYYQGEYHLFYQHNPDGIRWGNMTWAHAVSKDLLQWEHLPIAIPQENGVMIFSGSVVVDEKNTSGFGKNGQTPMIAIYTGHEEGTRQTQHLAFSLDKGRTWEKYNKNPILDLQQKDFRDPKVFWHKQLKKWLMVVSLPQERKVLFYHSSNLKDWLKQGEFKDQQSFMGIWECPDIFPIRVTGTAENKWVFMVSLGDGSIAGGTGMMYYVGDFDGKTFKPTQKAQFLDFGKDYYAAITYNNAPNGRTISLGWLSNWQYANQVPATTWCGGMTLPRDLLLMKAANGYKLYQKPLYKIEELRTKSLSFHNISGTELNEKLANLKSNTLEIFVEFEPNDVEIEVAKGQNEASIIQYDAKKQQLSFDRTKSGNIDFSDKFAGKYTALLSSFSPKIDYFDRLGNTHKQYPDKLVNLRVFVDRNSVEIFANNGVLTMTNLIFPSENSNGLQFKGKFRKVEIHELKSVW